MKTTDYLKAARYMTKEKNYGLAKIIGISESTLSRYEDGERVMDEYVAMRISEILNINPIRLIAQAAIEREQKKNEKQNKEKMLYWFRLREKMNEEAKKNKEPFSETL